MAVLGCQDWHHACRRTAVLASNYTSLVALLNCVILLTVLGCQDWHHASTCAALLVPNKNQTAQLLFFCVPTQSLAAKTGITLADVLLFSRQDVQVVLFALATVFNMWWFMTEVGVHCRVAC